MKAEILTFEKSQEIKIKNNIDFFMRHLSLKELKIIENLALDLAKNYSESYIKWKLNQ